MTPLIFRRQTTFIMDNKGQKSTISEKTEKKSKSRKKSWLFKKFWLLWLLTSMRVITAPPVPDRCSFWKKSKKFQKSAGGGDDFKKVDFWPPQPAKKWWRSDSIDMGPKNLSFSRQIRAACKNLANSKGGISSTWVFVQGGLYRQRFWRIPILERAGPLPLP